MSLVPSSDSYQVLPTNTTVTIIGTGLFGRALASHIRNFAPHLSVITTSRSTPLTPSQAVQNANFVVLAVPCSAYHGLLADISPNLKPGTVIIDVANRPLRILKLPKSQTPSTAESLLKLLPEGVGLVKGMTTVGAQKLMELKVAFGAVVVPYAANEQWVVNKFQSLMTDIGFTGRHWGSIQHKAAELEALPHKVFPNYKWPVIISTVVWIWWIAYSALTSYTFTRGNGRPPRDWYKAPLSIFMASTGEVSMTMFAITYLPGPIARLIEFKRGKVGADLGWLGRWLDIRKELGMTAWFYAVAHGIAGAITAAHIDDEDWKSKLYFVFGIM